MISSSDYYNGGEPGIGNIEEYQKGYDPVCVNWESVLENISDDANANKYVFNY